MFVNDEIDFYRETLEGDTYLHDGKWLPLDLRFETIEVAGEPDVVFEVRSTHHGPLLEDGLAMWWTFTQHPENRIHEAFYGFSRQPGLEAFKAHAELIHAPGLNMMYGDAEGDIAWIASAKLPIRAKHVNTKVAIDGSHAANDVQGWHSFEVNPKSINPEGGFVYSANNAPSPTTAWPTQGTTTRATPAPRASWMRSPRKERLDVADAQALQLDHHSPVYRKNAAKMVALAKQGGADVPAFMDGWDGGHLASDIAPTLYYRWMYRTIQGAMYDEFEQAAEAATPRTSLKPGTRPLSRRTASPCCCKRKLGVVGRRPHRRRGDRRRRGGGGPGGPGDLAKALGETRPVEVRTLHTVVHRHAMTDAPLVGDFMNVGLQLPAAKDALNKYEFKLKEEVNYDVFSGPSMRIGIDFADVGNAESILPTGQSGNVFSPHYDDQAAMYHAGQFRKQRMDRDDVEAHVSAKAVLRPQN